MRKFAALLILPIAWVITTNITDKVVPDSSGSYTVVKKTFCTTVAPVYKSNGDITLRDSSGEIVLRSSEYLVEQVETCP